MPYEAKTDWKYDDIVTERDLNRIERGVQDSQVKADEATTKAIEAEANAKAYTDQQIQLVTETGIPKLVTYPYVLTATTDGQTDFVIPFETFNKETDTVMVIQNSSVVSPAGYSVIDRTVRLVEGVEAGTELFIQVFKNVPIGPEGAINGAVIAVNSLPSDRVQGFDELFTSVSDGKAKLETAITDKDGTVSKQGDVATFDELDAGIKSIPQAKGNATRADVLAGKTFSSEVAGIEVAGTMPNNGARNGTITTQGGQIVIPEGYASGGTIRAQFANLAPTNVKQGVNIGGVVGTLKPAIINPFIFIGGTSRTPFSAISERPTNPYLISQQNYSGNDNVCSIGNSYIWLSAKNRVTEESYVTCSTNTPIDLTNISYCRVRFESTKNTVNSNNTFWYYFGFTPGKNDRGKNYTIDGGWYMTGSNMKDELQDKYLNVTRLTGNYYFKAEAEYRAEGRSDFIGSLYIYDIVLIGMYN